MEPSKLWTMATLIAEAVEAISRSDAVPTLLQVLCDITGMRFAVVAQVTDTIWTACAVKDDIQLGVIPGSQSCSWIHRCGALWRNMYPCSIG